MAHFCKSIILHCMDFRLQKAFKDYLEKNNSLGDCDVVSLAGGVKNLGFVLEQISLSVKLHNIREVIISNHLDCGAYKDRLFGSAQEERDFQIQEMQKAKTAILGKHPELKVKMILAKIISPENIILEEIK